MHQGLQALSSPITDEECNIARHNRRYAISGARGIKHGALVQTAASSTYTYLLADQQTKEAVLIDPVLEQVCHLTSVQPAEDFQASARSILRHQAPLLPDRCWCCVPSLEGCDCYSMC